MRLGGDAIIIALLLTKKQHGVDLKENVEPIIITTYGVVFQETDKVITVAQNYGYNPEQVCSLMTIPKGCIQSIKEIDHIEQLAQKGE